MRLVAVNFSGVGREAFPPPFRGRLLGFPQPFPPGAEGLGTRAGRRLVFLLRSPRRLWGFPWVGAAGRESAAGGQRGTSHFRPQGKASRVLLIVLIEINTRSGI